LDHEPEIQTAKPLPHAKLKPKTPNPEFFILNPKLINQTWNPKPSTLNHKRYISSNKLFH